MAVRLWLMGDAYEHMGKMISIPKWFLRTDLDFERSDDLREYLDDHDCRSSWWQLQTGPERLYCQWQNPKKEDLRVINKGLYVSETDPSMLVIGAGWVETEYNGRRLTGRVTGVHYGEMSNYRMYEGTTYQFLKQLGDQFTAEQQKYERWLKK